MQISSDGGIQENYYKCAQCLASLSPQILNRGDDARGRHAGVGRRVAQSS